MSQENLDVLRRATEAFAAGDLDGWLMFFDPEVNWRAAEGALDDVGEMRGTEAMRGYVQDWIENFEGFRVVVDELLDIGHDRAIAVQRIMGRARLSGIETQVRYAVVYTLRNGKIVRGREYFEKSEALKAVGLAE